MDWRCYLHLRWHYLISMNYSIRWLFLSTYYLRIAVLLSCSEFFFCCKIFTMISFNLIVCSATVTSHLFYKNPSRGAVGLSKVHSTNLASSLFSDRAIVWFVTVHKSNQIIHRTLGTFLLFIWFDLKEREIDNVWFERKRNVIWKKDK